MKQKIRSSLLAGAAWGLLIVFGWLVYAFVHDSSFFEVFLYHGLDPLAGAILFVGLRLSCEVEYVLKCSFKMVVLDALWCSLFIGNSVGLVVMPFVGEIAPVVTLAVIIAFLGIILSVLVVLGLCARAILCAVNCGKFLRSRFS